MALSGPRKTAVVVARSLLGILFFVFGLNGFFGFLPEPELPPDGEAFVGALIGTGYMWPLIKATEAVCGFFLLIGRFVPLALTVLAPVVLNIVLFDAFLAPSGLVIGLVAAALGLFLAWSYRGSFRRVLAAGAQPTEE